MCADPVLDIGIASITVHENYIPDSKLQNDDIALIRLSRPVRTSDFVRPICLPFAQHLRNRLLDREPLVVTGFGKTESGKFIRLLNVIPLLYYEIYDCSIKERCKIKGRSGWVQF